MKIVVLQSASVGEDVNIRILDDLGDVTYYPTVTQEEVIGYAKDAQILLTNKNVIDAKVIDACPHLKMIGVMATGSNNIDGAYAREKGIVVTNVKGYSTPSVAQTTLTMGLSLILHLSSYDAYVKAGHYSRKPAFSYFDYPYHDLEQLRWGIVGFGAIGSQVAEMVDALGMEVVYYSSSAHDVSYQRVDFETLLKTCDVISIHLPLTSETHNLFDQKALSLMKPTACLINVGRGGIVNEADLVDALNHDRLGGAGLDVFEKEPMPIDSVLYQVKDQNKLLLTPHLAWASIEARQRLCEEIYKNIEAFIKGEKRNVVNGL